jgi:hypothetical protein
MQHGVRGLSPWWLGFGLVVGLGLLHRFPGARPPDDAVERAAPESVQDAPERGSAVLVVEVESRDLLERLRRRFPRERLLVSERDVIAIEGCIFAYELEAVSGPLNRLGWGDRRIDLITRARAPAAASRSGAEAPGSAQGESNLIADLAKKKELSRNDALALLRDLDRPGH